MKGVQGPPRCINLHVTAKDPLGSLPGAALKEFLKRPDSGPRLRVCQDQPDGPDARATSAPATNSTVDGGAAGAAVALLGDVPAVGWAARASSMMPDATVHVEHPYPSAAAAGLNSLQGPFRGVRRSTLGG